MASTSGMGSTFCAKSSHTAQQQQNDKETGCTESVRNSIDLMNAQCNPKYSDVAQAEAVEVQKDDQRLAHDQEGHPEGHVAPAQFNQKGKMQHTGQQCSGTVLNGTECTSNASRGAQTSTRHARESAR
jgi:hypothetical protein